MTENIGTWEEEMMDHYTNMGCVNEKKKFRTTGVQMSWKHDNNPVITVTFYHSKGKFMVQPGARDPVRLDEWMQHCT